MNLSATDAAEALKTAGDAGERMTLLRRYSAIAPFLLLWGAIWLVCDVITDFNRSWSTTAWLAGMVLGFPASFWIGFRNARNRAYFPSDRWRASRTYGLRVALTWIAFFCFFWAAAVVLGPFRPKQWGTFLSIFWAFVYMFYGIWVGWRLFAIGLVTVAGILLGYLFLKEHYYLWLGVVGGGSLILGGLWLRKA